MSNPSGYRDTLLSFLHQPNLFVIEDTKTSMKCPFEISPNHFLSFAENDLASKLPHKYVNALANIKRALDCQVLSIFLSLGMPTKKIKKLGLERKLQIIQKLGLVSPRILNKVTAVRNLMEHEFTNPDKETVIDMKDVISLFIAYTDTIMMNFSDEVVVALKNENDEPDSEEVKIYLKPDKHSLEISSNFSPEKIVLSPSDDDFFVFTERLLFIRWGIGTNPLAEP
ncbi:MAG: hypothetical protein IPM31_13780 [Anaerolineae bacterium]|nr:hypothetical protein [Anaerolineae bacterium]MCC7190903.1 hypothetical protein [Anaerolineales bacterium]